MKYLLVAAKAPADLTMLVNEKLAAGWTVWAPPFSHGDAIIQPLILHDDIPQMSVDFHNGG